MLFHRLTIDPTQLQPAPLSFCRWMILCALAIVSFSSAALAQSRGLVVELRSNEMPNAPISDTVRLYRASYALVIGIDAYEKWPKLSKAVQDAELVAQNLTERGFLVTLERNLSGADLERALKDFFIERGDDPEAQLFVWFAGHGQTINGNGYLVPSDAPLSTRDRRGFRRTALPLRRFGVSASMFERRNPSMSLWFSMPALPESSLKAPAPRRPRRSPG